MSEEKKYCIYVLENKVNGKKYVGQSAQYEIRMKSYSKLNCKKQIKLYNAIKKYGWLNFTSRIIVDNITLDEANEIETYFIKLYDTTTLGYNISKGGRGFKGHSEKTKIKMSKSLKGRVSPNKGKKLSLTQLEKLKNCNKGNSYRKGAVLSEETKLKISLAKKGKPSSNKGRIRGNPWNIGIAMTEEAKAKLRKFTNDQELDIYNRRKNGESLLFISKIYNTSDTTILRIYRRIKKFTEETLLSNDILN